jgi:hydroxymethylpyrimidine/phosphomethylpyrimidine kinase
LKKILLSIAGFDPTSGAGVSLDLKVFDHLGFRGMAILTSLTSQSTSAVEKVQSLSPDFLWNQYQTLRTDVFFYGIKVGMIGSRENLKILEKILSNHPKIPKVIDPVFMSSSGTWLFDREGIPSFLTSIKEKASLLTPNRGEASLISGIQVSHVEDMKEAAEKIYELSKMPCLIKGGDLLQEKVDLFYDGKGFRIFRGEKIDKKVHGTGCFLSSSLLAYLAKGKSLEEACSLAIRLTYEAIKDAVQVGKGQYIFSI